jgi:hypothetical protein
VLGVAGGFALAIGTAEVNRLIVGAKQPVSILPYCVVGFEGGVLLGALANLAGLLVHARLGSARLPPDYDRRFSRDKLGLATRCDPARSAEVRQILTTAGVEEIHAIRV